LAKQLQRSRSIAGRLIEKIVRHCRFSHLIAKLQLARGFEVVFSKKLKAEFSGVPFGACIDGVSTMPGGDWLTQGMSRTSWTAPVVRLLPRAPICPVCRNGSFSEMAQQ
jgi:hypothetical protein